MTIAQTIRCALLEAPATSSEIAAVVGLPPLRVRNILRDLRARGHIAPIGKIPSRRAPYNLYDLTAHGKGTAKWKGAKVG